VSDHLIQDSGRIERMIALAERLVAVLESDIAALKSGNPAALASADPAVQTLTVQYGREARNFDPRIAQAAPLPLRTRFLAVTAKFREVLQLHTRLLARVKNASEGMVKAIAEEVNRMNQPTRTYGPRPGYGAQASGAMVFNRVV
jgi:hypothetical protein